MAVTKITQRICFNKYTLFSYDIAFFVLIVGSCMKQSNDDVLDIYYKTCVSSFVRIHPKSKPWMFNDSVDSKSIQEMYLRGSKANTRCFF